MEDNPGIVVTHAVAALGIEQIIFFAVTLLQPALQRFSGIVAEADRTAFAIFLPFKNHDLFIGQVHIDYFGVQQLANAHAGSEQQQDHRSVAHIVQHGQQAFDILSIHGSRQCIGNFELDLACQKIGVSQLMLDQIPQKCIQRSQAVAHRDDLQSPVLLMLHKGFQVLSADLVKFTFSATF